MYEAYFQLQKRPFSATPDASCLFAPEPIQGILNDLTLRVGAGLGIGLLVGGAGVGKTLICRRLAREFEGRFTPILLPNVSFPTRRELLQSLHFELGRRYAGEEFELRMELISSLKGLSHNGRPALLIVDEAHLLNEKLLEELRSLATLSEGDEPLLRLILVGQLALEMRLIDPALEALNQRIACHLCLETLTRQESVDYVAYRVRWAGGDVARLFTPEALETIARVCNGLPRCLNQLCDHSLLLAFVQDIPIVTTEVVNDALNDLKQLPLHWNDTVTSTMSLDDSADALMDEGEMDVDLSLEPQDSTEMSAEGSHSHASSHGPTVAFEIGGGVIDEMVEVAAQAEEPVMEFDSPAIASPMLQENMEVSAPAVVSLPEQFAPAERTFQEEFVEDRYAALDQRSPRVARTFEETRLVGGARTSAIPLAPVPPQPAVVAASPEVIQEQVVDFASISGEPLIPAAHDEHTPAEGHSLSGAYEPAEVAEGLDVASRCDDALLGNSTDVEERLGSDLLDTCQELRETLGAGWESPTLEPVEGGAGEPYSEAPYDVVEPESAQPAMRSSGSNSSTGAPQGRYVPKPNYRNVFSRLRRRIGSFPRQS